MTLSRTALGEKVADLREAFDQAFAALPESKLDDGVDLLAIRVAGDAFALRIADLAGLSPGRKVVPVPTTRASLVGLAGIRGAVVPVYRLATLLGYDRNERGESSTPWLALVRTGDAVALAFDELEGFLRVERGDVFPMEGVGTRRRHVVDAVRSGDVMRMVVDARSVLAEINIGAGSSSAVRSHK